MVYRKLKTYLTMMFYSEGANPVEVVERLRSLGFEPVKGIHDHVYDWGRDVELDEILQIATSVHETLKGSKVLYQLDTR
ncbi:MAG: hypothetical protein ACOC6H_02140 [Thermoproteota archaeon]